MYKEDFNYLIHFAIEFNFFEWMLGSVTTFFIIYFFRAKIKLGNVIVNNNKIKIPIINDSSSFMATNIIVEVALVSNDQTFHFKLDRNEFILIPRKCKKCNNEKNIRTFCTLDFERETIDLMGGVSSYLQIINNISNNTTLRVRIHANHEFTNFGKAFEFNFRYDGAKFIKI
jgi:hypothetical protein